MNDNTAIAVIRVLIVDDHEMVAQGLSEVLATEQGIEVVGRAGTVRDAKRMAAQLSPHVVVMDYRLPDGDGLMATAAIRDQDPDTAVVMVTASDHDTVVAAAIQAGCAGFVTKDRAAQNVVTAVRIAARGEVGFPAAVLGRLVGHGQLAKRSKGTVTPRELEVLQLLADGLSTRAIADRLTLSTSTVRNHTQNILTKLDAHSKLEAVSVAMRQGIVGRPD